MQTGSSRSGRRFVLVLALAAAGGGWPAAGQEVRPPVAQFSGDWQEVLPLPRRPVEAPPRMQLTVSGDPEGDRLMCQWLLVHARGALTEAIGGAAASRPAVIPASLAAVQPRIEVSLRIGGKLVGLASARGKDAISATEAAAVAAARDARFRGRALAAEDLAAVRVGMSVQSQPQRFNFGYGVPVRRIAESLIQFKKYVEIGVYGVGAIYKNRRVQFSARTPICCGDPDVTETVLELYRQLGISDDPLKEVDKLFNALPQVTFYRFRCDEFVEHPVDRSFVMLYRGVSPFAVPDLIRVGREGVEAMCRKGAEYMLDRQLPDGSFHYLYLPATDQWPDENNEVRQAGAAWAMAVAGRRFKEQRFTDAAVKAIKHMESKVHWLDAARTRACIVDSDGEGKLGTVALTLCAILELPAEEQARFVRFRDGMLAAVINSQQANGSLRGYFRPAGKVGSEDYAPGEALLALAMRFETAGDRACLETLQTALGYYRPYFRKSPNLAFVTWQAQAYGKLFEAGEARKLPKTQPYAQFVFEMCDWLMQFQLAESNAGWPDCLGGFVAEPFHRPGIGTAAYLEGLVAGLRVAKRVDRTDRGPEYARGVIYAMRMVGQLYCRPADTYYMARPERMEGAFRFSLLNHSARIDNNQHAVCSLMAAAEAILKPATRPAGGGD